MLGEGGQGGASGMGGRLSETLRSLQGTLHERPYAAVPAAVHGAPHSLKVHILLCNFGLSGSGLSVFLMQKHHSAICPLKIPHRCCHLQTGNVGGTKGNEHHACMCW